MWTQEIWKSWSTEVERISGGAWMPEPTHGTFTHTTPRGDKFHVHVTFHGNIVTTSWGTPTGNDAKTVLDPIGDRITDSARRWVKGPGSVRLAKYTAALENRDKIAAAKTAMRTHAKSLVAHMTERGLSAHFWEGSLSDTRADVRVTSSDAHFSLNIYPDRTVHVTSATGAPRSIEILAAAVDDWVSLAPVTV